MVIRTSACKATSRGFEASFAPCLTSDSAFDAVRFQTVTGNPAFTRFEAIGPPIKPSPINPIVGFISALPNPLKIYLFEKARANRKFWRQKKIRSTTPEKIPPDAGTDRFSRRALAPDRPGGKLFWIRRRAIRD